METRRLFRRALRRVITGGVLAATVGMTAGTAVAAPAASAAPVSPQASSPPQYAYTALPPTRVADTRCGVSPQPALCAGEALPLANTGLSTVPAGRSITVTMPATVPANAAAVVVNVTAVDQSGSGFLTVWPTGTTRTTTSTVNYDVAQQQFGVPNLVTVALGTATSGSHAISIYNGPPNGTGGSVDVTVDLEGFYAPPVGTAGGFNPLQPSRIADSRCTGATPQPLCAQESLPAANSGVVTLGPAASEALTVTGVGKVPSSGVAAVMMDVTVTDTTASSFLSVYPPTSTRPQVSNLNWTSGETLSNKVIVDVGPTGQVTLYNHSGSTDVVVDVEGWFTDATATSAGSLFTPMDPARLADTRCGVTSPPASCAGENLPAANAALAAPGGGTSVPVAVDGQDNVPNAATAAVLDVIDVHPATGNYLTVYPGGTSWPTASDVNYVAKDAYGVVPDAAYGDLGSNGAVDVRNGPSNAGPTDVVADLFGYFSPAGSSPAAANVVTSLTSLLANGASTSTVTTTLTSLGSALAGVPVTLTGTPSVAGACGTLSPVSGVTNAAGQFVSTYTSSATAGVCTITAALDGLSPTAALTQVASSSATGSLVATVTSLLADGTSTSGLTTTVLGLGLPLPGVPVTLNSVPSVSGACGTLSPGSGVTNLLGQFTSTYTSSTTAGICTVTASLAGISGLAPSTALTQAVSGSGSGTGSGSGSGTDSVAVSASPTSLTVGGVTPAAIQAKVTSPTGNPVSGDPVSFSASCGTVSPSTTTTNTSGVAKTFFSTSGLTVVETCTVTATEADTGQSGQTAVTVLL